MGLSSGQVTGTDTQAGLADVQVKLYGSSGEHPLKEARTDSSGHYSFTGLAAGSYRVGYSSFHPTGYLASFYAGASSLDSATPVAVTAGQTTANIDAELVVGGRISGTLVSSDGGNELQNFAIAVYEAAAPYRYVTTGIVGPSLGSYTVVGLPTGSYRLWFVPATGDPSRYLSEYYNNAATLEAATPVSVTVGQTTSGIKRRCSPGWDNHRAGDWHRYASRAGRRPGEALRQ